MSIPIDFPQKIASGRRETYLSVCMHNIYNLDYIGY